MFLIWGITAFFGIMVLVLIFDSIRYRIILTKAQNKSWEFGRFRHPFWFIGMQYKDYPDVDETPESLRELEKVGATKKWHERL